MKVSSLQTIVVARQVRYIYTFQALFWEIEVSLTKYTCSQMLVRDSFKPVVYIALL